MNRRQFVKFASAAAGAAIRTSVSGGVASLFFEVSWCLKEKPARYVELGDLISNPDADVSV